ncbi:hypothetical protein BLNAU_2837 [Blattamonas nauphoetae]|uniref:Uncharacterized protein n=1 Tax=Blattamonas nauphoetae TaxID=2049346 RepID=A0ABQ9YEI1_9EUKA|nr:hypothetical protein BLNAU_2837 [Blattamonas nauphoetae]
MNEPPNINLHPPLVSILKPNSQKNTPEKNTITEIIVNREPTIVLNEPYQYTEDDEREEFLEQLSLLRYEVSENPNNLTAKELLESLEAQLTPDNSLPSHPRPIIGLNVNEIREPLRPFSPTSPRGWMEVDELDSIRNQLSQSTQTNMDPCPPQTSKDSLPSSL